MTDEITSLLRDLILRIDKKVDRLSDDVSTIKERVNGLVTREECLRHHGGEDEPEKQGGVQVWVSRNKRIVIPATLISAILAALAAALSQ